MSISPPYLKKGDLVAITCPAKKPQKQMSDAVVLLQSWGLRVVLGDTISATWHQFAGDDSLRAADLQQFIDNDEVKAIFAARGGYGTVRIIDMVNFGSLKANPKWVIGFSDITVLHSHLWANYSLQSIHGQMPVNIPDASARSLENLRKALFGEPLQYSFETKEVNRAGTVTGEVIGGNLSLLINILNSPSDFDYSGKILFMEDVGEYLYSIDRMMYTLKRAGKLKNLAGLVVGGFTALKDNDIPFGFTVPQIIIELVKEYNYPVGFDFPAGHIDDNNALILGRKALLTVDSSLATLKF